MRSKRHRAEQRLRTAVEGLPPSTRRAMLEGLGRQPIVIGAYTTRDGGICPGLAAHRCGGRSPLGEFARAWDSVARPRRPRRASQDELALLERLLRASAPPQRQSPAQPTPAWASGGQLHDGAPARAPAHARENEYLAGTVG
jgi:hypothetical protein